MTAVKKGLLIWTIRRLHWQKRNRNPIQVWKSDENFLKAGSLRDQNMSRRDLADYLTASLGFHVDPFTVQGSLFFVEGSQQTDHIFRRGTWWKAKISKSAQRLKWRSVEEGIMECRIQVYFFLLNIPAGFNSSYHSVWKASGWEWFQAHC